MHTYLKTGDILHCRGRRLISKAIMWATKSNVSHTALFVRLYGLPYVIDSQKDGTNLRPFDEWMEMYNYYFEISRPVKIENQGEFIKRALSKTGNTAYDLEGLLIRQPWKLITGKWKHKPGKNQDEKMYCSEYVAWVYNFPNHNTLSPREVKEYTDKSRDFYPVFISELKE
jgi:hypothetical protein